VTVPVPELADGAVVAGLRLLPAAPLPESSVPESSVPESSVPERAVPEPAEPDVPVLPAVAADPELAAEECCAPGSANATAPAATTPRTPAVAVTVRIRA